MICAAVFETDEKVRELLREWTVEYLIRENRELNLLWFTQNVTCLLYTSRCVEETETKAQMRRNL